MSIELKKQEMSSITKVENLTTNNDLQLGEIILEKELEDTLW